jgi:hypothetical protein
MKVLIALSLLIFFTSCKEEKSTATPESSAPAPAQVALDASLFSQTLDKGLKISEARKLAPGDKVTVSGKIIGAPSVFVEGRASFVMGDPEPLISCDIREGDGCTTPWDVCCMDSKSIAANTLSVQVVDKGGKVLKLGLKGQNGLKELAFLTVQGTIAPNSSAEAMIINAEAIQVNTK